MIGVVVKPRPNQLWRDFDRRVLTGRLIRFQRALAKYELRLVRAFLHREADVISALAEMIRDCMGVPRMTKSIVTTFAFLASATIALAATEADTNGDGLLTIDEVQAVMPEISAEAFSAMDLNSDGALDAAEVQAAQEAGLMPA